jgi:hypothetical protein
MHGVFLMQLSMMKGLLRTRRRMTHSESACVVARFNPRHRYSVRSGLQGRIYGAQVLNFCSGANKDESGHLIGSAWFSVNPAWGRSFTPKNVQCVLTRRTRLQYMQCNGVGGSTC